MATTVGTKPIMRYNSIKVAYRAIIKGIDVIIYIFLGLRIAFYPEFNMFAKIQHDHHGNGTYNEE